MCPISKIPFYLYTISLVNNKTNYWAHKYSEIIIL